MSDKIIIKRFSYEQSCLSLFRCEFMRRNFFFRACKGCERRWIMKFQIPQPSYEGWLWDYPPLHAVGLLHSWWLVCKCAWHSTFRLQALNLANQFLVIMWFTAPLEHKRAWVTLDGLWPSWSSYCRSSRIIIFCLSILVTSWTHTKTYSRISANQWGQI